MDEIYFASPLIRKCECGGEQKPAVSLIPHVRAFICDKCYETSFEIVNPMASALSQLTAFLEKNGISFEQID